jgi:hypothetical protein
MKDITIGTVGDASLTARIATVETATTTSGLVAIASRGVCARLLRRALNNGRYRSPMRAGSSSPAKRASGHFWGKARLRPASLAPAAACRSTAVRVMMLARALSRRQEKGKAYGAVTAKALALLTALLWRFHNTASGKRFPSYEATPRPLVCKVTKRV